MLNKNFDEKCLDNLNIEEIRSLLKSNVMDWGVRKRVREILGFRITINIITDSLPLVTTVVVIATTIGFVKELLDRLSSHKSQNLKKTTSKPHQMRT